MKKLSLLLLAISTISMSMEEASSALALVKQYLKIRCAREGGSRPPFSISDDAIIDHNTGMIAVADKSKVTAFFKKDAFGIKQFFVDTEQKEDPRLPIGSIIGYEDITDLSDLQSVTALKVLPEKQCKTEVERENGARRISLHQSIIIGSENTLQAFIKIFTFHPCLGSHVPYRATKQAIITIPGIPTSIEIKDHDELCIKCMVICDVKGIDQKYLCALTEYDSCIYENLCWDISRLIED